MLQLWACSMCGWVGSAKDFTRDMPGDWACPDCGASGAMVVLPNASLEIRQAFVVRMARAFVEKRKEFQPALLAVSRVASHRRAEAITRSDSLQNELQDIDLLFVAAVDALGAE